MLPRTYYSKSYCHQATGALKFSASDALLNDLRKELRVLGLISRQFYIAESEAQVLFDGGIENLAVLVVQLGFSTQSSRLTQENCGSTIAGSQQAW